MFTTSFAVRLPARGCGLALLALCAVHCWTAPALAHAQGYGIRAWGDNSNGNLGTGFPGGLSAMPVRVKASPGGNGLTNVVQVAAGASHAIALKADGTVWTWGDNSYGQLGNGTTNASSLPVQVMLQAGSPLTGITSVAAAGYSSYAVAGGSVYAWGDNQDGQLGNSTLGITQAPVTYPVKVSLPSSTSPVGVTVAAGEFHALALQTVSESSGGTVHVVHNLYAWGDNSSGQLGQGTIGSGADSATPLLVTLTGTSPAAIAAAGWHCLALDAGGNVWAWGTNNSGESGKPTIGIIASPEQVGGISDVVLVAAGGSSSYAVAQTSGSSQVLYSWGLNVSGQLGIGSESGSLNGGTSTPARAFVPPTGVTISAVVAGDEDACMALSDGSVHATGANLSGQLGSGEFGTPLENASASFQPVQNLAGATAIAAGSVSCYALTNDFKLVWQDTLTGITPYWDFGSTSTIANTYQSYIGYYLNPAYRIVASLDLFKDGNRSLLLQNGSTGALAYLRLNGADIVGGGPIPASPTYSPNEAVVGTMNIDGSLAIVWQNTTTGEVDYWTMGLQTISGVLTPVSTGGGRIVAPGSYKWQVAAAYPAGGENWIIWHDISSDSTAGELVYQQVGTNGAYIANSGRVYQSTVPAGWSLHVEDVNGDGNPDFIWHDTNGSSDPLSGETYIWLMNGPNPTFKSSQQVSGMAAGQVSIPIDYYIGAIL